MLYRENRKYYPKDLIVKATEVERGYYDYGSSGPLLACVWRDKRIIHFLTTINVAEPSSEPAAVRRVTILDDQVVYQQVVCPPCVPDYQQYMRETDVGDQMMGYYQVGGRSLKRWKRGFWYLLDVALLNTYIVYTHDKVVRKSSDRDLEFRIALAEDLIGTFTSRRQAGRPRSLEQPQQQHMPLRLDSSQLHLPLYSDSKRDCVVCAKARVEAGLPRTVGRHRSSIMCKACNMYLCLDKERLCYEKYHTAQIYWTWMYQFYTVVPHVLLCIE